MPVKQLTTSPSEADLEARIDAAIRAAFSWLPPDGLRHQTKFAFQFGRAVVEIDGASVSQAQARADVLVLYKETPLAVLELKRPGVSLTEDDEAQGLSYARMLHPRPPLVVVTNGEDTRILATHTGALWEIETRSEAQLAKLIAAAGQIAANDLKRAVEVLLGPQSSVWMTAMRAATDAVLSDLSGGWSEAGLPFIDGFLIPRTATRQALAELRRGKRMIIVEGPPLVGKSNILRELAASTKESDDVVVLFVEADGGSGSGLLQIIADLLSDALGWQVTAEDTRTWLRRLSRQRGPSLVIAVDGISATRNEVRRDLEELTSDSFGPNLRIVITADDTVTPRLVQSETGRKTTRIGRRTSRVPVAPLEDGEFRELVGLLEERRIGIMVGGQSAPEFRIPWVIRALVAYVVSSPQYADESLMAGLPPLLGPDLLLHARERFEHQEETRHLFQALAEAVIAVAGDRTRPLSTVLESMSAFTVRRQTVGQFIDGPSVHRLMDQGLIRIGLNEANERIVVVRLPELLASELALLLVRSLAAELASRGPEAAAEWLTGLTSALPFGDVIGARALFDCAELTGNVPLKLIEHLLSARPRRDKIRPGTRAALHVSNVGVIDLTFRADGTILARSGQNKRILRPEDGDDFADEMYADVESWLILSHVAARPFVAESPDGDTFGRVDPALLMEIGACPIVLRRPVADQAMNAVVTHDIKGHGPIVCHEAGIVEPITLSILKFIGNAGAAATAWVDEAVQRKSLPLLARVDIALRRIADRGDTPEARWARETMEKTITPAFNLFPPLH
jgi:Type I restriction enzyme R protein N terminus (HSDR_N)